MSTMTIDPMTGNALQVKEYRFVVTLMDDAAFYGLMVYVYDWTGVNRWFLPIAATFAEDPVLLQALRYGLMFGSMNEMRRWMESMGITTDLSKYLDGLVGHLLGGGM